MWHSAAIPGDFAGREAIAPALALVIHDLKPLVATFFTVGENGEIDAAIAHGSQLPPAQLMDEVQGWEAALRGIDPLAPEKIAQLPGGIATLADVGGVQGAVLDNGWVRGTYEQIGVINDVRMLIRDGDRLVAGVSLWRRVRWRRLTSAQLRRLATLQPLVELAYVSCLRAARRVDARLPETLTPRQREVARLLARGATTPDVARALFISPDTAKSHVRAVLDKLGVGSRRELIQYLQQSGARRLSGRRPQPGAITPPPRGGAFEPAPRLEDDREAKRLLECALGWSTECIDATVGGCAFLSARGEVTSEAWSSVRSGPPEELARNLHQLLLLDRPAALVEYLEADPRRAHVLEPDVSWPLAGELLRLTGDAGLSPPLVTALHSGGRVAGVIWLCRDAGSPVGQEQSADELRRVHPLLELVDAPRRTQPPVRSANHDDLTELGLSERELAVARMALAGESNAVIARRLDITQSTVKKHVGRVLAKTGVRSRTQLIALLGEWS